jgi:RND family efflux transporter MFP subunit
MRLMVCILVAAFGFVAQVQADPTAFVQLATARLRTLSPTVPAYGTVAPDPSALVTVALPRDGVITAVSVRAGQSVRAGDPIATVETAPSASAVFLQAKSALTFAEKDLARTRALYAETLATATQLASAEKAVSDARAALHAQTTIGAGRASETLRARDSGVVTAVNVSPGERVQANAVIVSIALRGRFIVALGFEPSDAAEVARGDSVSLRVPQRPGIVLSGKVQSVDAMMDPKSRLVNAIVSIPDNPSLHLVLGSVLDATVSLAGKSGVVVPQSALMSDAAGSYVYVISRGIAHRRAVHVLFQSGGFALLERGIASGDAVAVAGNAGLSDGLRVQVK